VASVALSSFWRTRLRPGRLNHMEEKRTIIAFVLIGLILLLMPYFYELTGTAPATPPPISEEAEQSGQLERERKPEPSQGGGLLEAPAKDPGAGLLAQKEEAVPPPPADDAVFAPKRVHVTTPLQELVFSSSGGSLMSARLLSFDREEGMPVELVPAGSRQLTIRVRSETSDRELDLSEFEFAADSESIRLQSGQTGQLRMVADLGGGKRLEKTFNFDADQHAFDLTITCSGCTDQELLFVNWQQGINRAEKNHSVDLAGARVMAYVNESKEELVGEDEWQEFETRGSLKWAGVRNKYFLCAVVPKNDQRHWVELSSKAGYVDTYGSSGNDRSTGYDWPELNFSIGGRGNSLAMTVYLGPLDLEQLEGFGLELERSMDLGFPVVRDIARVLLLVFVAAHEYVPNYGMLIVLFAVVVKILVYPLTHKSYESASKMQEVQPKVAALKEKYKNDSQRLSKETMALYKAEGVNPIGGCLPLLLQMPIFIALYQVFSNTIELRHAPFVGWISDLSVPDELMVMGFGLHVLPLLMSAAMFFQSKMTMKDPKQAMLVYMMPAVMIFIMWDFSSGLVLYWTVFNVLTIGQQYLTNHLRNVPEPVSVQPLPKKRSK
jgi:YidC/Oxa1 family membrane protein insertase